MKLLLKLLTIDTTSSRVRTAIDNFEKEQNRNQRVNKTVDFYSK